MPDGEARVTSRLARKNIDALDDRDKTCPFYAASQKSQSVPIFHRDPALPATALLPATYNKSGECAVRVSEVTLFRGRLSCPQTAWLARQIFSPVKPR